MYCKERLLPGSFHENAPLKKKSSYRRVKKVPISAESFDKNTLPEPHYVPNSFSER
jgi:hypothetical protein